MKKLGFFVLLASICMLVGCAGPYQPGIWYSNMDAPMCSPDDASGLQIGSKTGTSQMVNYVGVVAIGDASIQTAARNAGISKVKTVDVHYNSILGIINTTTTKITGD
jgi:hypothetical protein